MQKQATSFSTTVLIALLGVLWTSRLSAEEQVLFDFDQKTLSVDWSAVGKISATRKDAPAFEPREGKQPGGKGITVTTEGKAGLYAKTGRVPDDWDGFDEVSFWIHRSEEEARERAKSVLEVQVYESDMKARFWHRVEVDHKGWKQVSLPLRWFRWGDKGRVPRWNAIDRFGFWFRDGAVCSIDMVFVKTSKTERAAYFDVEQLSGVAFSPADDVKILENQEFAVLSNAPLIQMEELDEHLRAVMSAVVKDLPFIESPSRTPILLIFETREEYRGFTPRFARQLNSNAIPPSTHGYTI
ncbi:MAG: hypothetical protein QGF59_02320, partial [Pirellulaceae bacterium]|nr:hypothetical protein [Pirellulaceae bacterium]